MKTIGGAQRPHPLEGKCGLEFRLRYNLDNRTWLTRDHVCDRPLQIYFDICKTERRFLFLLVGNFAACGKNK